MNSYSDNKKRKIIMDNYLNPNNRINVEIFSKSFYHHAESCADDITIFVDDNKNILGFNGDGCAIHLSSTNIFLEEFKKQKKHDLVSFSNIYKDFLDWKEINEENLSIIGDLKVFKNVKNQMNRYECALMINSVIKKMN